MDEMLSFICVQAGRMGPCEALGGLVKECACQVSSSSEPLHTCLLQTRGGSLAQMKEKPVGTRGHNNNNNNSDNNTTYTQAHTHTRDSHTHTHTHTHVIHTHSHVHNHTHT